MKYLLQLEEFAQVVVAIIALSFQPIHFSWWLWLILFFSPDIFMLGYLVNTKIGAVVYNLGHHKAFAIAFGLIGFYSGNNILLLIGLILFAHGAFDRALGFGLKYPDSFKHTHIDRFIGKQEAA